MHRHGVEGPRQLAKLIRRGHGHLALQVPVAQGHGGCGQGLDGLEERIRHPPSEVKEEDGDDHRRGDQQVQRVINPGFHPVLRRGDFLLVAREQRVEGMADGKIRGLVLLEQLERVEGAHAQRVIAGAGEFAEVGVELVEQLGLFASGLGQQLVVEPAFEAGAVFGEPRQRAGRIALAGVPERVVHLGRGLPELLHHADRAEITREDALDGAAQLLVGAHGVEAHQQEEQEERQQAEGEARAEHRG